MSTSRSDFTTWVDDAVRAEFEEQGYWTSQTWLDLFLAGVDEQPSALCVADEQAALTRAQVLGAAQRLAGYMAQRGVNAGDVVTVAVPNWREFVVIHTAVGLCGAVLNPVLPRLGVPDYRHILQTSRSRMVFAAQSHHRESPAQLCRAAAEGLVSVLDVIAVRSAQTDDAAASLEQILSVPGAEEAVFPGISDARDWDTVTFTSGTEALPKGVIHTHQSTMFGLRAYIGSVLGLTTSDCVFMPSPVCHASGLQWGLRAALYSCAPLILQDRWDPWVALSLIDKHRCTYTLAATPFIVDLIAAREADAGCGDSLRYVCSGGAPIPRRLVADVRRAFGAQLLSVFGASETYIATCARPQDGDEQLATDGIALPGVQIAIVDEDGAEVAAGVDGEITNRGPNTFLGYLGDPALTQRAFRGSWYRFGDLATMDGDGRIRVTGRVKDIVIRGGENISAREIEELLADHPGIGAVAVVGYPDARLGERCCAVVVPAVAAAAPTLADLCSFLRQRGVAKFKLPERLCLADSLPLTATGKVKKAELRALVANPRPVTGRRGGRNATRGYGIQDKRPKRARAKRSGDGERRTSVSTDAGTEALASTPPQRGDQRGNQLADTLRRETPLGNQIADTLRREILLGVLPSGTQASQQQLCERFGTSRMPVRDALRELVHEGLMTLDSARHIVVAPLSKQDLLDAFTIEGVLTGMAAERASQRASAADLDSLEKLHQAMLDAAEQNRQTAMVELNWSFHRKINHLSGSRKLIVALRKVSVDLPRDFLEQVPEWNVTSNADHAQILAAMRLGKHKAAGKYMAEHVSRSGRGLVEHLSAHGVQFD
jgi:acyl-CoA synthetase (AMP-forming)/AMP-acid ligase II/DNA-binding GntR family transcriptional regulator